LDFERRAKDGRPAGTVADGGLPAVVRARALDGREARLEIVRLRIERLDLFPQRRRIRGADGRSPRHQRHDRQHQHRSNHAHHLGR
jgi:hypothetical protein